MPDAGKPVKIINNNKNQRKKRNYSNKKTKNAHKYKFINIKL